MPRPKYSVPQKRAHISGQDRVYLHGKHYYLGPSGSEEARTRYDALVAIYLSNGRTMPEDTPTHQAELSPTVAHITEVFRGAIKTKYANSPDEARRLLALCRELDDYFGDVLAEQFGPLKLESFRDLLVASGITRRTINGHIKSVIRIFKYAVSRELIPVSVVETLRTLESLRYGQTTAPEQKKRTPVSLAHVKAKAEYLSPVVKAMVVVQLGTGMRPSEMIKMRPCDIDTSGEVWIYRPVRHKTMHAGKQRVIPILGESRSAIAPYMDRGPEEYCFSPAESYQWHLEQRAKNRKTPRSCGNRAGTNRKANPRWKPGSTWRPDTYRNQIIRAAKKAGVPHWTPYQMRHTNLTHIRQSLGIEYSQALGGHSTRQMAEHYARVAETKAIEAALAAPSIA